MSKKMEKPKQAKIGITMPLYDLLRELVEKGVFTSLSAGATELISRGLETMGINRPGIMLDYQLKTE